MNTPKHALIPLLLACGLSLNTARANEANTPLNPEQIGALSTCAISIASAKQNLLARGYRIVKESSAVLVTDYKVSERDSERRLLGSISLERARQYTLNAQDATHLRWTARYQETKKDIEDRVGRRSAPQEVAVDLARQPMATLEDMRSEICPADSTDRTGRDRTANPSTPNGRASIEALGDYLLARCKQGDDTACQLLKGR